VKPAADLLVAVANSAKHGVKHKTHGDQVTVEQGPYEHIDSEYDGLGDIHDRPDNGLIVVLGRQEPRHDQPHEQSAEADNDERAEYGGQPGPALAHQRRIAVTTTGKSVLSRLQRDAYPVSVSR